MLKDKYIFNESTYLYILNFSPHLFIELPSLKRSGVKDIRERYEHPGADTLISGTGINPFAGTSWLHLYY